MMQQITAIYYSMLNSEYGPKIYYLDYTNNTLFVKWKDGYTMISTLNTNKYKRYFINRSF